MRWTSQPVRLRGACALVLPVVACFSAGRVLAHGVSIGHDSAGRLRAVVHVPMPAPLPPSPFPGTTGWAAAEPGLASAELDDPANDLFLLDPNCDVQFILVGMDPGVQIVTSHVWVPGETFEFGPPFFDDHMVFNIPDGKFGQTFALQFRLHDLSGIYADSPVYTLTFTPVATNCFCRGDMDADQARTGRDVQAFVDCMMETGEGSPPDADCACADMDGDGALDSVDVDEFVTHLLASDACQ